MGVDTIQNAGKRSDFTENRTVIRMRVLIIQDYEGLLKPEGNVCTLENEDLEEVKTQANCLRYAVVVETPRDSDKFQKN